MAPPNSSPAEHKNDDRFYLVVFVAGFFGAGLVIAIDSISAIAIPPVIYAMWLSAATAVLVYRWLGGIPADTEGKVFGIRITGSLAALVALLFVINPLLPKQMELADELEGLFEPHYSTWIPMQRSPMRPIEVTVVGTGHKLSTLNPDEPPTTRFRLTVVEDGFGIQPPDDETLLGLVSLQDVLRFMHPDAVVEGIEIVERIPAGAARTLGDFSLRTGQYGEDQDEVRLIDTSGGEVLHRRLGRHRFEQFHHGGRHYVLAVIGHDHLAREPWASFALMELAAEFRTESSGDG